MADNQMISFAASSSSSSLLVFPNKKYDVFLSFRGEDTRKTFTSHLYDALCQKKIETYIDNRLEKGDEIGPELIKAIEESHISVVIFSENYANSKWCLDEISKIMECRKKIGQIVIPVFYSMDPSHVRNQKGSYEKAFTEYEQDLKHNNKVHKWKTALTEAANLAGWVRSDSQTDKTDAQLIKQIIEHVLQKLKHVYKGQNNPKALVGIHEQVACLESLVAREPKAVRVILIWGMGCIGKTTIAKELYDKLCFEYEACCFMQNVRENLQKHGVTQLQNDLLRALLEEKDSSMCIPIEGCQFNMTRLRRKKVLLVLDDVDDLRKLTNLSENFNRFGEGSRVILTSRDKQVPMNRDDDIYEVKTLNIEDSLKLFSLHAFKENHQRAEWMDLSDVVNYAQGIPLAIEVLGSSFHGKEKGAWESQLKKLKKMPLPEIQNVLRWSYDGLDREEQDIFLYLACFFSSHVYKDIFLLDDCGYSMEVGLTNLHNKALISFCSASRRWTMHDLIREMGKEIVCGEHRDPGKRRHIRDPHDVYEILENATGTRAIQSLTLDMRSESKELCLNPTAFSKMFNLKILKLDAYDPNSNKTKMIASEDSVSMPKGLRLLEWWGCPLKSLDSSFCAENLVELDFSYSKLKKLWDGVQNLVKMKEISLVGCDQLKELPDFSKDLNVNCVTLEHCTSLLELHPSIFSLHNLRFLLMFGCKNLKILHSDHQLNSLKCIDAAYCTNLEAFSVLSESMEELDLKNTSIVELHSLGSPVNKLESLNFGLLKSLPHNFLQVMNLWDLRKLTLDFFDPRYLLKSLNTLYLNGSNIKSLPTSIKNLSMLKGLWLSYCKSLQYIPPPPPSIDMLEARGCIPLEGVSVSTLDCNWHSKANFSFWNCCKLNQQALNTIMSFSHLKINGAAYIQHLQPNDDKSQRKRNIVSVCLPGSKVPVDRYNYRTATECTISIQLSNLSDLLGLNFCVVFALCEYISCQDVSTKFTCYLITRDGQEDIFTAHSFVPIYVVQEDIRHNSDHVFLWHQQEFSKVLMDKIKERCTDNQGTTTYDPKLTFAMTPGKSIKVKEWGVRPIYSSDLFSFSVPLAVETKTKRKRDSEELLDMKPLSPTKKLKTQYSRKDMSFHQRNM